MSKFTYPVTDSDTGAMVLGRAATEEEAIQIAKKWDEVHGCDSRQVLGATLMLASLDTDPDINGDDDLADGQMTRAFVIRYAA